METYKLKRQNENGHVPEAGVYGGYQSSRLTWCHVAKPHRKSTVQQLCAFEFCRESLIARVFDQVTPGYTKPKLATGNLRIAVKTEFGEKKKIQWPKARSEFGQGMKAGLHIINAFEKENKWQDKTVMHKLVPFAKPKAPEMEMRMFEAHENWIRSSQMLSLFTLIFRMTQDPYFKAKGFIKNRTVKSIMEEIEKYTKKSGSSDRKMVERTMRYWAPLIKDFEAVFKDLPATRNFHRKSLGKKTPEYTSGRPYFSGAVEGIELLCTNYARDKTIKKRFHEVIMRRVDDA